MSFIGSNFIMGSPSADDLRARGWMTAIHNDYTLHGVPYTFWLFTRRLKSGITVSARGEGYTDKEALDSARMYIMDHLEVLEALDTEAVDTIFQRISDLERELGIQRGSDGREYVLEGVTPETVKQLRTIAANGHAYEEVLTALRIALRFYDLVRAAWRGLAEEYKELDGKLVVARNAAERRGERITELVQEKLKRDVFR